MWRLPKFVLDEIWWPPLQTCPLRALDSQQDTPWQVTNRWHPLCHLDNNLKYCFVWIPGRNMEITSATHRNFTSLLCVHPKLSNILSKQQTPNSPPVFFLRWNVVATLLFRLRNKIPKPSSCVTEWCPILVTLCFAHRVIESFVNPPEVRFSGTRPKAFHV